MQIVLTGAQSAALAETLIDNNDREEVVLTNQGDNSVVVAFEYVTYSIDPRGNIEEAGS